MNCNSYFYHNIKCGLKSKIPLCCVIYYTFFWHLFIYEIINILFNYQTSNRILSIINRGNHCGYIRCPFCKIFNRIKPPKICAVKNIEKNCLKCKAKNYK